jgi:hypothetical protein
MKKYFFLVIVFAIIENILAQNADTIIPKKKMNFDGYLQTYQTLQVLKENGFSKNKGLKNYNSYFGLLLSVNLFDKKDYKPNPIIFSSNLKRLELLIGFLINPQQYGGSSTEQSILPKYKFNLSCIPILLKFNYLNEKRRKYYFVLGFDGYIPIFNHEINSYENLNRFYYHSQVELNSFHFETGITKSFTNGRNINISGIIQIFPRLSGLPSHGINKVPATPFCAFGGISINYSFNLLKFNL